MAFFTALALWGGLLGGCSRTESGESSAAVSSGTDAGDTVRAEALGAVHASALLPLTDNQDTEVVTLAGNLCTSADIIAKDVSLPRMEIGDGLALDNAGCYAAVMTPMQFAFMAQPAQLFLTRDGRVLKA